ncbi:MAG: ABC transporter ATP-binding protein [Candidatus Dormibacteria bacterium]
MSNTAAIEATGLGRSFGEFTAIQDLEFRVEPGQLLVLLGQNGAGKTTALRCLAGLLPPSAGRVRVHGVDPATEPERVRGMIGLVAESPGLYERMTAVDYLRFFGRLEGMELTILERRIEELLFRFDLAGHSDQWLSTYSKGMKQKVALIRATIHQPPVILCDEPTSAMDASASLGAWDYLLELRTGGAAVVVSTHHLKEAARVGGRVAILRAGRILAQGNLDQLRRQLGLASHYRVVAGPDLEEVYLAALRQAPPEATRWHH